MVAWPMACAPTFDAASSSTAAPSRTWTPPKAFAPKVDVASSPAAGPQQAVWTPPKAFAPKCATAAYTASAAPVRESGDAPAVRKKRILPQPAASLTPPASSQLREDENILDHLINVSVSSESVPEGNTNRTALGLGAAPPEVAARRRHPSPANPKTPPESSRPTGEVQPAQPVRPKTTEMPKLNSRRRHVDGTSRPAEPANPPKSKSTRTGTAGGDTGIRSKLEPAVPCHFRL